MAFRLDGAKCFSGFRPRFSEISVVLRVMFFLTAFQEDGRSRSSFFSIRENKPEFRQDFTLLSPKLSRGQPEIRDV